MRDDFDERIKRLVAARVGNLCSNPACRALTSGPTLTPDKSLNLGVAAHITAASPGGPRYDPTMPPEERRSSENAIWLCQNCAKLIDNDVTKYSEVMLREWKAKAELAALSAVGKPGELNLRDVGGRVIRLQVKEKIKICPAIPRKFELDFYTLEELGSDYFAVFKESNQETIRIPSTGTVSVHRTNRYATIQLRGRLQWVTPKPRRGWIYFPEEPPSDPSGYFGLWKPSSFMDANVKTLAAQFPVRWFREDSVPAFLTQGWHIFYDEDGRYFRVPGPDCDQILLCQHP